MRSEDGFWGEMEKGGSQVKRHRRTRESAVKILEAVVSHKHPQMLKIQREMLNEGRSLEETSAGMEVNADLEKAREAHLKELAALKDDWRVADEKSRQEIAELINQQHEEMAENERARGELEANMERLEAERAEEMQRLQIKLQAQMDNLQLKESQMGALQRRCEEWDSQSAIDQAEKSRMQEELKMLRKEQAEERRKFKEESEKASRRSVGELSFKSLTL